MNLGFSPFFILGNPRSGTTLLRLMLDSHSLISVPPECGFMVWFYDKYKSVPPASYNSELYLWFIEDLKTAKKIENWNLDYEELNNYLGIIKPKGYDDLTNAVYSYYALKHNVNIKIWGDKNNFYLNHVEDLVSIFPTAKFIHIVRDGRDVACSYKELNAKNIDSVFAPNLHNDIIKIASEWNINNMKIIVDLDAMVKPECHTLVRYEDLVAQSEVELTKIASFLKVEFEADMLKYYKKSSTYEPEDYLQWKANTKKAPQADRIKRYQRDLTTEDIENFNSEAHELLKKFKYEI